MKTRKNKAVGKTRIDKIIRSALACIVIVLPFTAAGVASAAASYPEDGVSTYKSNKYESADSVFTDGEIVYVSVMDWVQTVGSSRIATAAHDGDTITLNLYDDGTSPDPKAGDGIYWGVFTVGTGDTDDATDYLHLPDGEEATITADVGDDGTAGTATILAYYTNPTKVTVNPGDSIQDAIDSLPAEGGIVELASGLHEVADTIIINKGNVTVQGTHDCEVRLHGASGKHLFEIPHLNTTADEDWNNMPMLSNLRFKGFKTTNSYVGRSGSIVYAWNVRHITVEDILDESDNFYGGFVGIHNTGSGSTAWGENIFIKHNEAKYKCRISTAFCKNSHMVGNIIPGSESVSAINVNRTQEFVYVRNNYAANAANHSIRLHSGNYVHCYGNICEGSGEGIWGDGVSPAIIEDNIVRNVQPSASRTGSGIRIDPQPTLKWTVRNNLIYNCRKGIYTSHYDHGFSGYETHATIINNVIYNCTEGGIIMGSPYVALDIRNNIIGSNGGYGIDYMETTELPTIIEYNNVWNNGNSVSDNYNNTNPGIGDISVDPLFADPDNGDFHLKSTTGRWTGSGWVYTDAENSSCIDFGYPDSDYSREPEPNGGRINMGAYGNTEEASKGSGEDTTPPVVTLKVMTINGSVNDATITEVEINGIAVTVTAGAYSHEVDVSSTDTITITAVNGSGQTLMRIIEIK